MRTCLRFHLATRAVLLGIALAAFANVFAQASYAQAGTAMPKSWTDAMAQLADKIAANLSPSRLTVETKNISSLDASYASAVELALTSELRRHSFQVASADSQPAGQAPPSQLHLTLAESADDYVWVVEMPTKDPSEISAPAVIVSVPKTAVSDGSDAPSLALATRLVWKQPDRFLDFVLGNDAGAHDPRLIVLETSQIAVYKPSDSEWQLVVATPVPRNAIPSRDPQGTIDLKYGYAEVAGSRCFGELNFTEKVRCMASGPSPVSTLDVVARPKSVGTIVPGICGGESISLYTGEGDWTRADSIQGYLTKSSASPIIPSGNAIQFDGPVIYVKAEPDASAVRAIVHNLKTGNYEAYIVTATCSH